MIAMEPVTEILIILTHRAAGAIKILEYISKSQLVLLI